MIPPLRIISIPTDSFRDDLEGLCKNRPHKISEDIVAWDDGTQGDLDELESLGVSHVFFTQEEILAILAIYPFAPGEDASQYYPFPAILEEDPEPEEDDLLPEDILEDPKIPARTGLTVISADRPWDRVIGFSCYERPIESGIMVKYVGIGNRTYTISWRGGIVGSSSMLNRED